MRDVRFYHSCSPPPPPPPPRLAILVLILLLLLRQHLLHHLCIHFSRPLLPCQLFAKLFANVRAQCAPLDLNLGHSQLSVHRWTSTWDIPSSVGTAGPQPGTFPAQWALNLGPSQLSVHCWTSSCCPAQCAPLDLNGQIQCQKICQIECQTECQKICQIKCHEICQIECQKICQIKC